MVSDDLWTRAHGRLAATRGYYLRSQGKRRDGRPELDNPYLLSGFTACADCGRPLLVKKSGATAHYKCGGNHRGKSACSNGASFPVTTANEAVLNALLDEVLEPGSSFAPWIGRSSKPWRRLGARRRTAWSRTGSGRSCARSTGSWPTWSPGSRRWAAPPRFSKPSSRASSERLSCRRRWTGSRPLSRPSRRGTKPSSRRVSGNYVMTGITTSSRLTRFRPADKS